MFLEVVEVFAWFFNKIQNDAELLECKVHKVNDAKSFFENFDSVISCQKPFLAVLPSKNIIKRLSTEHL